MSSARELNQRKRCKLLNTKLDSLLECPCKGVTDCLFYEEWKCECEHTSDTAIEKEDNTPRHFD